jgi:hypothetical protein
MQWISALTLAKRYVANYHLTYCFYIYFVSDVSAVLVCEKAHETQAHYVENAPVVCARRGMSHGE